MILKTIKTAKELPFSGVELVKVDKNITEVIVGGKLRIRVANTYSNHLDVLLEAPHETTQRWRMTATLDGFDPKVSYHDTDYDARAAGSALEAKGAEITVESVEVQIDEGGDVVASEPKPDTLCDLPF